MPVKSVVKIDKLTTSVKSTNYAQSSIKGVYPFRIKFQDLGYPGYSPSNVPGIGIAIIGSTFYIL